MSQARRNPLDDLPTVTLWPLDGPPPPEPAPPPAIEPEPEPGPEPEPEPHASAEERKAWTLVETRLLVILGSTKRPMSASEIRFHYFPKYARVGPVKDALDRLVEAGRLAATDSPSSFTRTGVVRMYMLRPREGPLDGLLAKARNRRIGPAEPRPRPRDERGRS